MRRRCAIFIEEFLVHGYQGWLRALASKEQSFERSQTSALANLGKKSLLGSSFLVARSAVGAANIVFTLYSSTTRQKADASGVPTGLPSYRTVEAPVSNGA